MKTPIYIRAFLLFILLAVLGFASVPTIIQPFFMKDARESAGKTLYDQAYTISNYYRNNNYKNLYSYRKNETEMSSLNSILDSTIWIMDFSGKIIYDTSNSLYTGSTIKDFDLSYFNNKNIAVGTFFDTQPKDTLSVIAPITTSFDTIGYVVIHLPQSSLEAQVNHEVDKIYIIYGVMLLLSGVLMIIFLVHLYIPLKKIRKAASAYGKGDLKYGSIQVHTHDELREIADNLEYMASQLNDLEEYQQKFIANISHDFRSPLTSIKGYVEAILDGTIPPEMQDKYLQIVLNETERLTKLTSNLLKVNAWDNQGRKLMISNFDIVATMKNTLSSFLGTCQKKKITFDVTYGAKSYMVSADEGKIQQVLYNLIDNALKFSHNNSVIYISVMARNEKIFVSVKDTGIGIPKDCINKIWDRFYKTDLSRGKDKTGSGLGLAITKEIIQSHNENIDVISTEGAGTEFVFSLKRA